MESKSYGLLAGKTGVISGALIDTSIAWAIAEAVHREGGRFVLTNAPVTQRFGQLDQFGGGLRGRNAARGDHFGPVVEAVVSQ